ncbi:hypothetical protein [Streptomyces californicus]|uniref:hypothetical protein n=1 Tax=Streptomyces californicus TaxID=67351 RepID=UPI00296F7293|nr:hypothetical protein [Streptomyces californicus]MDW4912462.1 hypothetical protein [Streptomyces californicus]
MTFAALTVGALLGYVLGLVRPWRRLGEWVDVQCSPGTVHRWVNNRVGAYTLWVLLLLTRPGAARTALLRTLQAKHQRLTGRP